MTTNRITRRQAMTAGLGIVAAGTVTGTQEPRADPNASWVGKTVLPKKYGPVGLTPNPSGKSPELPHLLDGAFFEVKGEKGTRAEVFGSVGTACWIEKEEFVPLSEAIAFFTKAIEALPADTVALVSRGWAYYLLGKSVEAVKDFDAFLKITPAVVPPLRAGPERWEGLVARGLVFAETGEFEKAFADLDEAIKVWPNEVIARVNRGYAYDLKGDPTAALADYDRALALVLDHLLARNNKAWVLATCPDDKVRDGVEAVKLAKAVCQATADREGMYLDTLAAAYAEIGKFADAVKAQEKALEDKGYAARYGEDGRERLKLYKAGKPFRTEPVKK